MLLVLVVSAELLREAPNNESRQRQQRNGGLGGVEKERAEVGMAVLSQLQRLRTALCSQRIGNSDIFFVQHLRTVCVGAYYKPASDAVKIRTVAVLLQLPPILNDGRERTGCVRYSVCRNSQDLGALPSDDELSVECSCQSMVDGEMCHHVRFMNEHAALLSEIRFILSIRTTPSPITVRNTGWRSFLLSSRDRRTNGVWLTLRDAVCSVK